MEVIFFGALSSGHFDYGTPSLYFCLLHSLAVLLIVASLAVLLIMAVPGSSFDFTLRGISVDCSGSTFDCDTLLMFFCSTLCMQILWNCLTVPMISALPGRTFDCDSSWKYF